MAALPAPDSPRAALDVKESFDGARQPREPRVVVDDHLVVALVPAKLGEGLAMRGLLRKQEAELLRRPRVGPPVAPAEAASAPAVADERVARAPRRRSPAARHTARVTICFRADCAAVVDAAVGAVRA
eukprot:CAMPEP_0119365882 /NCGR_PEP_ID=MMETSP1334-20130426/12789_1 /TAXON_ID=127549 /ORGANISM="Calcidiscus leptoporus, Strain RCC1130" /LENGTH=127 /DNA_ID=CAMNT_0007381957 /DNA_START=541 /DNA_END=925 /DNA_ORIENTATION=+